MCKFDLFFTKWAFTEKTNKKLWIIIIICDMLGINFMKS